MLIDQELHFFIKQENERQKNGINLIASESPCFEDVKAFLSSCLTNKYAEGRPGNRFYSGCKYVDEIELLAEKRCKELYKAEYANVQPHSGTQANQSVYMAFLKPGEKILSMDFSSGGHLSHGHPLSITSSLYKIATYPVHPTTHFLDYDLVREIALKEKPQLLIAGASSYSRQIDYKKMRQIADEVGAYLLADMAHVAGLVAAGAYESPVPYAHVITATTHKTLRGPRGAFILSKNEYAAKINRAIMPGMQGGPFMNVVAAKAALFFRALQPEFVDFQKNIINNARLFADMFIDNGHTVISGGTDSHLFVVDVSKKGFTGKYVEEALEKQGIYLNRNAVPYDQLSPLVTSGIRIGTTWITAENKNIDEVAHNTIRAINFL